MRRTLKHTLVALAAAGALGASAPAHADPVILVTLASYAASGAGLIAATTAAYIALGVSIVGGVYARKQASRASAAAREARAAAMTDRCVTLATAEPEPNVVYGRCTVGGWVIDKITTPKTYVDDRGSVRTKPDAYQHIVIGIAGHECQAVHDVFMYGEWVGAINADGWVIGGPTDAPYGKTHAVQASQTATFTAGAATLAAPQQGYTISRIIAISQDQTRDSGAASHSGATLSGLSVTGGPASGNWVVTVEITKLTSSVRIEFHTGTTAQLASPYLRSVAPAVWTDAHRLLGITYAVITFDLDDSRHQGIPGDLAFEVSGRKVLDPRTGTTALNRNPALCIYDWMRAPWGYNLGADDIDTASVIAAANASDQQINLTVGGVTSAGKRYTLDGAFGVNADKSTTLADMLETMGGFASQSAQWAIHAGAWTAPVMDLTDDDLAAPVRIVRSHTPIDERFNAAKATYLPERKTHPSEVDPYLNTVFVAADGGREWGSFTLPFTSNKARGRNLLRQFVEQSRAGLLLQYTGKMRLWPLQVGDRVKVTNSRFGLFADTFRVLDWSWSPGQPVTLTLQRDIAASYDDADASSADPAPATRLPNPGVVDTPSGLTAASGTAQLLKMADGTIIPRVLVSWNAPATIYMSDPSARTIVSWRRPAEATWNDIPALAGNTTSAYLDTVRDRDLIIIRVRHVNSFGVASVWVAMAHIVVGKTAPPSNVTSLTVTETASAGRRFAWLHDPEIDHGGYEIRASANLGADWVDMPTLVTSPGGGQMVELDSPPDGQWRFAICAMDSTGHYSAAPLYVTATLSGIATLLSSVTVAANAAAAAAAAQASANNALGQLQALASDGVLSRTEKPAVKIDWAELNDAQAGIVATANSFGIVAERDTYTGALTELGNYLGGLAPSWSDTSTDTTIVPATWQARWTAAYSARQALLNKISAAAKALADAAQATGSAATAAAAAAATAATAAQTAAAAAQTSANNALGQLQALASDGVLSKSEKPAVKIDWSELSDAQAGITATATSFGIVAERDTYTTAMQALDDYLSGLGPNWWTWSDTSQDTTIIPATWQARWTAAYSARQALLNKISATAKALADTAQATGGAAQAAAAAAQTAASAAQASANTALGQIQAISSDGVLSRGEKSAVILDWAELWNGQTGIVANANALGIVSERDAYTGAINSLAQHLLSLSPGWSDTSADSIIVPAVWRGAWDLAYQARQTLLNRIAAVASQRASWSSIGGIPDDQIYNSRVGQASNLINCQTEMPNNSTAGWVLGSWVAGVPTLFQGAELAREPAGTSAPVGANPICLAQGIPATTANTFVWGGQYPGGDAPTFAVAYTEAPIPVRPGVRYCASAWVANHRCAVDLYIEFKGLDGSNVGGGYASSFGEVGGGRSLGSWLRLSVFAEAPASAVSMRLLFAKRNTWAGQNHSYAWMVMPMIERAGAQQTVPSDYSPSAATSHGQLGIIQTADTSPGLATDLLNISLPYFNVAKYRPSGSFNTFSPDGYDLIHTASILSQINARCLIIVSGSVSLACNDGGSVVDNYCDVIFSLDVSSIGELSLGYVNQNLGGKIGVGNMDSTLFCIERSFQMIPGMIHSVSLRAVKFLATNIVVATNISFRMEVIKR